MKIELIGLDNIFIKNITPNMINEIKAVIKSYHTKK